jgi:hypothetical protein
MGSDPQYASLRNERPRRLTAATAAGTPATAGQIQVRVIDSPEIAVTGLTAAQADRLSWPVDSWVGGDSGSGSAIAAQFAGSFNLRD